MGSTGDAISGPGILFVNSKIARNDLIDEKLYLQWYDEDHIPEILKTSGVRSALRFKDVNGDKAEMPYLAMYPMEDIGFTQSEEFRKIKVHSPMLPGQNSIYDLCDFDVRVYKLVQVFEPKGNKKGKLAISSFCKAWMLTLVHRRDEIHYPRNDGARVGCE